MKIMIMFFVAVMSLATVAQATTVDAKDLVQALAQNSELFAKFAAAGNSVTEATQTETPKGTVYKLTTQFCKAPRCLGGAIFSILDTGLVNGSTGQHVYKTDFVLIR